MGVHMKALSLAIALLPLIATIAPADSWKPTSEQDLKYQSGLAAIRCSALASLVWKMYDTLSIQERGSDFDQKKSEIGIQVTRLTSYGIMALKQVGGAQLIGNTKQTGARVPALQGFLALQSDDFVWGMVVAEIYYDQYREIDPVIRAEDTKNQDRAIVSGQSAQAEFDKRNCNLIGR